MRPRTKLVLMMALFAMPTLASFAAFYWFPPTKTSNYGELISPVINLPPVPLSILDGTDAAQGAGEQGLRGKWLIITRDSGACGAACEQKLFAMRQYEIIITIHSPFSSIHPEKIHFINAAFISHLYCFNLSRKIDHEEGKPY